MADYFITEVESDGSFSHFGVKGMHWGVRKSDGALSGIPKSTIKAAKKDAEEYTRAKLFYGKGAGTRRKLINAKVEANSKRDPAYKKAFDHHVSQTDLGKRASQAQSERRRKDVVSGTAKTARGVHRSLTGGFGAVTLTAAVLAGAYTYARSTGADKVILNNAKTAYSTAKNNRQNMKAAKDFLKSMNM